MKYDNRQTHHNKHHKPPQQTHKKHTTNTLTP